MLSVVIASRNAAPDLAALMRALVPAAMDGLVREVVVADPAADADTEALCEAVGALLVAGGLREAAAAAKAEVLLAAPPGLRLGEGWISRLNEALGRGVRRGLIRGEGRGGLVGLFTPAACAVLVGRATVIEAGDLDALRRRVRGPRI